MGLEFEVTELGSFRDCGGVWEEGRERIGFVGPEEEEEDPKTLPWPLNLPEDEDEDEKGLLTFFMNPLTLSFMSPIFCTCKKKKKNAQTKRIKG